MTAGPFPRRWSGSGGGARGGAGRRSGIAPPEECRRTGTRCRAASESLASRRSAAGPGQDAGPRPSHSPAGGVPPDRDKMPGRVRVTRPPEECRRTGTRCLGCTHTSTVRHTLNSPHTPLAMHVASGADCHARRSVPPTPLLATPAAHHTPLINSHAAHRARSSPLAAHAAARRAFRSPRTPLTSHAASRKHRLSRTASSAQASKNSLTPSITTHHSHPLAPPIIPTH
jgi:hypothetical protein